ncbi:MAG TPA: hypothetical protein VGI39_22280 [Polyangiaceae bacterium]|jgi:serine/threonine-protein kinase
MNLSSRRSRPGRPFAFLALVALLGAASTASAEDSPAKRAEELGNQAYEQHAAGHYAEAIALYVQVYEISRSGAVLYNVATIYDRKLHERKLAMEYYRRYLAAPDAQPDLVRKANERLTSLKTEADAEARAAAAPPTAPAVTPEPAAAAPSAASPSPAPAPETEPPPEQHASALKPVGIVVGSVGVASLGTSLAMALVAKSKNDQANGYCNGAACTDARGVGLAHDAGNFATVSTVTFVAGLALVVSGAAFYLAAPSESANTRAARLTVTPVVGPGGGGLGMSGSF